MEERNRMRRRRAVTGADYKRVTPATLVLVIIFIISAITLLLVTNLTIVRDFFQGQSFYWLLRIALILLIASVVTYVLLGERRNLQYVTVLLQQLAEANRRLKGFVETGREIGTTLELRKILEALLEQLMSVTGARMGAVYLKDEEKEGVLKLSLVRGVDERRMMFVEVPFDTGLLGKAATSRRIITIGNMGKVDERDNMFFGAASPRSQAIVPLVAREKAVGVLITASPSEHEYREEEMTMLRGIAELASMAITSSRLYKIARRSLDVLAEQRVVTDSVLEEMIAGVITANPGGRIVAFNREAQRITGYSFAEKNQMLLNPEPPLEENPLAPLEAAVLRMLESPGAAEEGEAQIRRKDGTLLRVTYRAFPVFESEGRVVGAGAVFMEALAGEPGWRNGGVAEREGGRRPPGHPD